MQDLIVYPHTPRTGGTSMGDSIITALYAAAGDDIGRLMPGVDLNTCSSGRRLRALDSSEHHGLRWYTKRCPLDHCELSSVRFIIGHLVYVPEIEKRLSLAGDQRKVVVATVARDPVDKYAKRYRMHRRHGTAIPFEIWCRQGWNVERGLNHQARRLRWALGARRDASVREIADRVDILYPFERLHDMYANLIELLELEHWSKELSHIWSQDARGYPPAPEVPDELREWIEHANAEDVALHAAAWRRVGMQDRHAAQVLKEHTDAVSK